MDVSDVLKKAWAAVLDADLPSEIQPMGFKEAVRLLAPAPAAAAPPSGRGGSSGGSGGRNMASAGNGEKSSDTGVTVTENEIYERVVAQTGVDRDKLEQLVHLDDDGLRVSVPGLKLGKNNAERTRAVAQILAIARGFGLEENETQIEVIRAECDRLKVYDSANFSSHLKALNGYVINGTGTNRRLRMKGPGIQAFPTLVENLLGTP